MQYSGIEFLTNFLILLDFESTDGDGPDCVFH